VFIMSDDNSLTSRVKETVSNLVGSSSNGQSEILDGNGVFNQLNNSFVNDFFGSDVFNEEEMTPHTEMYRVREMIDNNAFVASALSTYQNIFLGDQLTVETNDDRTREWFNNEWLPKSGLVDAMSNGGVQHYKGFGNAYYHVKRGQATGMPKEVELIARPEDMWIRKNPDGSVKDYILEVDRGVQGSEVDNQEVQNYVLGYGGYEKESVFGVQYDKDEIIHVRQGLHQVRPYGRSDLASASSDEKIMREIERSYAVIARHKQVPKKIFSFSQVQQGEEMPINSEDWEDDIKPRINNLKDSDNMLLNGLKVDSTDYNYSGQDIKMQDTIDYLKRKITAPLGPQALIHGDMTTNAVSNDQLAVFFQEVRADRQAHMHAFKPLLREVAEKAPVNGLSQDLSLGMGDLELDTEQGKKQQALEQWNKGVLTLEEVRSKLELDEDELPDEFRGQAPFKWEVQSQPQPAETMQQTLRQALNNQGDNN